MPADTAALANAVASSPVPDCLVCAGRLEPWFVKAGRAVFRCWGCRLITVPEGLAVRDGVSVYEADQAVFFADGNDTYYLDDESNLRSAQLKADWVAAWTPAGRTLIDVGSGFGHFVEVAQRSFDVRGFDVSPHAVAFASERGVRVELAGVEKLPASLDGIAHAVTAWDLLEHVADPVVALRGLTALLAPEGRLFLSTPDTGSLAARVLGRHWYYLDPVQHINLFRRCNLARLLEGVGLCPLGWRSFGHFYRIRYVLDRLRYLYRGPVGWTAAALRRVLPKALDRPIYLRVGDVLGVVAERTR